MSLNAHIGLIFACPFDEEVENCPFKDFRLNYSTSKRMLLWEKMSTAEIAGLITQHQVCVVCREKKLL